MLVNSVATELQREVDYSTRFLCRSRHHINVSELRPTTRQLKDAALSDPGTRQVYFQDSRVVAGVLSKALCGSAA